MKGRQPPTLLWHHDPAELARCGMPQNRLELRRTFRSQLARKGVSSRKLAKRMANSPVIATMHFIKLVPEEMALDVEF